MGLAMAAGVVALTGASAGNAAVVACPTTSTADVCNSFDVGQNPGEEFNFFVTVGGPVTPTSTPSFVSAIFFNAFSTDTSFHDSFNFTLPVNGLGGGSLSLSLADFANPTMTISDIIINGDSYAALLASNLVAANGILLSVSNIPITAGVMNTIQVIGSGVGSYTGNIAFQATSAVPEPAAWAMMVAGFGIVGMAARRRQRAAPNFA
ncbi:FxDxF family PEP-CTERM protein [Sphingomonas quercus]|uniref:FxDxF family PEP-CTERM protein n=1 Tax=Sphingomonas quercus TaxID=2842451 RepID=A0ABS6BE99_9SPHN|nr:FxDxF family PEP-CTERM protein [Sphingomonas quercus]MBU3076489.1 FxDxF family PEP-CTERM protein [Sphingomonas quercus]